jgi:hypothetical protein
MAKSPKDGKRSAKGQDDDKKSPILSGSAKALPKDPLPRSARHEKDEATNKRSAAEPKAPSFRLPKSSKMKQY